MSVIVQRLRGTRCVAGDATPFMSLMKQLLWNSITVQRITEFRIFLRRLQYSIVGCEYHVLRSCLDHWSCCQCWVWIWSEYIIHVLRKCVRCSICMRLITGHLQVTTVQCGYRLVLGWQTDIWVSVVTKALVPKTEAPGVESRPRPTQLPPRPRPRQYTPRPRQQGS